MKRIKHLSVALAMTLPMISVSAAEVVIDLTASIDPTLSVLQANGAPMPQSLVMTYNAATRQVSAPVVQTRLHTNDDTQNVDVRLGSAAQLLHTTNVAATPIPLTVQLGGRPITTANTSFTAATLWQGTSTGESVTLPLTITGGLTGTNTPAAGNYTGRLEVLLVAAAAG